MANKRQHPLVLASLLFGIAIWLSPTTAFGQKIELVKADGVITAENPVIPKFEVKGGTPPYRLVARHNKNDVELPFNVYENIDSPFVREMFLKNSSVIEIRSTQFEKAVGRPPEDGAFELSYSIIIVDAANHRVTHRVVQLIELTKEMRTRLSAYAKEATGERERQAVVQQQKRIEDAKEAETERSREKQLEKLKKSMAVDWDDASQVLGVLIIGTLIALPVALIGFFVLRFCDHWAVEQDGELLSLAQQIIGAATIFFCAALAIWILFIVIRQSLAELGIFTSPSLLNLVSGYMAVPISGIAASVQLGIVFGRRGRDLLIPILGTTSFYVILFTAFALVSYYIMGI